MQHVLVVDRCSRTCTFVHDVLARTGEYRVSEVAVGEEAISVLDADRPNLMILDLLLPDMPGIELAAHSVERRVPVIVMTSEIVTDVRLTRLEWPHLRKPFRADELIFECHATLGESCRNSRIVQESLQRTLRARGAPREVLEAMRDLHSRIRKTLEASRQLH